MNLRATSDNSISLQSSARERAAQSRGVMSAGAGLQRFVAADGCSAANIPMLIPYRPARYYAASGLASNARNKPPRAGLSKSRLFFTSLATDVPFPPNECECRAFLGVISPPPLSIYLCLIKELTPRQKEIPTES